MEYVHETALLTSPLTTQHREALHDQFLGVLGTCGTFLHSRIVRRKEKGMQLWLCEVLVLQVMLLCGHALSFRIGRTMRPLLSRTILAMSTSAETPRIKVKNILEDLNNNMEGRTISVKGWVRTVRDQKRFAFVEINDGSSITGIQTVIEAEIPSFNIIEKLSTGAACEVIGTVVKSIGKGQKYEVKAQEIRLIGDCPPDVYPLQKKRHSQEFLRTIAHIRPRTNTISAVARVRSALAYATHTFFQNEGFIYLQSPLITASDCEGAGEMFRVTTLPIDDVNKIPKTKDGTDFTQDFFGKPAYLTVSGQLSGETYACAMGDIYTFGPTFRAENSQTTRHLAEFHMIEPEMAFADLNDAMTNAEKYVKSGYQHTIPSTTPLTH